MLEKKNHIHIYRRTMWNSDDKQSGSPHLGYELKRSRSAKSMVEPQLPFKTGQKVLYQDLSTCHLEWPQTARQLPRYGRWQENLLNFSGWSTTVSWTSLASKMKCGLVDFISMKVMLTNGHLLISKYECSDFKWKAACQEFKTTVKTLPMGSYDMVADTGWLDGTLGPFTFDLCELLLQFRPRVIE